VKFVQVPRQGFACSGLPATEVFVGFDNVHQSSSVALRIVPQGMSYIRTEPGGIQPFCFLEHPLGQFKRRRIVAINLVAQTPVT
jgi:hypothetical protein